MSLIGQLWGFIRGDQVSAEALDYEPIEPEPWIAESGKSQELADYALEACIRSAEAASSAVESVQTKAATLSSFLLAVFPLALAATAIAVERWDRAFIPAVGLTLLGLMDLLLLVSLVLAYVVSGEVLAGGLNVRLLKSAKDISSAKAIEADAWMAAAELAMRTGTRLARGLFQARRCVILALVAGLVGLPTLALHRDEARSRWSASGLPSVDQACDMADDGLRALDAFWPSHLDVLSIDLGICLTLTQSGYRSSVG